MKSRELSSRHFMSTRDPNPINDLILLFTFSQAQSLVSADCIHFSRTYSTLQIQKLEKLCQVSSSSQYNINEFQAPYYREFQVAQVRSPPVFATHLSSGSSVSCLQSSLRWIDISPRSAILTPPGQPHLMNSPVTISHPEHPRAA